MRAPRMIIAAVIAASLPATAAHAGPTSVQFRVAAHTGLRLADIVWTGKQFLYVENTSNRVMAAGPSGLPITPFAVMPRQVEETRCAVASAGHGFTAGDIFCHAPDNTIYRISPDGKQVAVLATLAHEPRSDGALAFDTVGAFGHSLMVSTGRSGGGTTGTSDVFAVDATGRVTRIGGYTGPGGADEMVVAPSGFGSAAGQVVLAIDAGKCGSLVAMDARGRTRTLVTLADGPNPIAVLATGQSPAAGAAQPGLYVTDTLSRDVFFTPAAALASYTGDLIVGSELQGLFWVVRPGGSGFSALRLATNLTSRHFNFEAAAYIAR